MGRVRVKNGGGRARFPPLEENPRELWVGITRGLSVGIITENYEREREREVKGAQSKPNPLPNAFPIYGTRACKKGGDAHESLFERKILRNYPWIITGNYHWELSVWIIRKNYYLVYQSRRKVEIYRDTGVSKKIQTISHICNIQREGSELNITYDRLNNFSTLSKLSILQYYISNIVLFSIAPNSVIALSQS